MSLCTGFRDAKVKAAMTKVIPGEWGLGSVSGRTLQHTRVWFGPPFLVLGCTTACVLRGARYTFRLPEAERLLCCRCHCWWCVRMQR